MIVIVILIIWNQSKLYNNVKVLQPAGSVAFYFIYLFNLFEWFSSASVKCEKACILFESEKIFTKRNVTI